MKRLIYALRNLDTKGIEYEILLVDNGSFPAVSSIEEVRQFLSFSESVHLLLEYEPGLTSARKQGIKRAKYSWLIFFDDDNEPVYDYLQVAQEAIEKYPQTAVWGAAEVEVEYIGAVDSWLELEKPLFQQRNDKITQFDNQSHWQSCYPFGTGLIIRKDIAKIYEERVSMKSYTLTDRKGKSLASGGDVQMVLTGIEQGYFAGVVKGLRVKHLIDTQKATLAYLQKQQYGTASAYIKAYNQVFVDRPVPVSVVNNKQVLELLYSLFRIHYNQLSKERFSLLLASRMGELNARVEALGSRQPLLLRLYERLIHA